MVGDPAMEMGDKTAASGERSLHDAELIGKVRLRRLFRQDTFSPCDNGATGAMRSDPPLVQVSSTASK